MANRRSSLLSSRVCQGAGGGGGGSSPAVQRQLGVPGLPPLQPRPVDGAVPENISDRSRVVRRGELDCQSAKYEGSQVAPMIN